MIVLPQMRGILAGGGMVIPPATDPDYAFLLLRLHCEGTPGSIGSSAQVIDSGPLAVSAAVTTLSFTTASPDVHSGSTAITNTSNGSMSFTNAAYVLGTDEWRFSGAMTFASVTSGAPLDMRQTGSDAFGQLALYLASGTLNMYFGGGTTAITGGSLSTGTRYWVEGSCKQNGGNNEYRLWVDSVQIGSTYSASPVNFTLGPLRFFVTAFGTGQATMSLDEFSFYAGAGMGIDVANGDPITMQPNS